MVGNWGYVDTATGASPIVIKPVVDRIRQFTYIFQSFRPQRIIFTNTDDEANRVTRTEIVIISLTSGASHAQSRGGSSNRFRDLPVLERMAERIY